MVRAAELQIVGSPSALQHFPMSANYALHRLVVLCCADKDSHAILHPFISRAPDQNSAAGV